MKGLFNKKGQNIAEYIILVALIAFIAFIAIKTLGQSASEKFNESANTVNSLNTTPEV